MKNSFDSRHKSRKGTFSGRLASLARAWGFRGIQGMAYEYLVGRYSGEFTIINAEREPDITGPIPVLYSSSHRVLTVRSDRFPDDTFTLRYGKNGHWTDNYYALLFRDEPTTICTELAEEVFGVDCIAEVPVFQDGWPDGIGENSTLQEWMQAGGRIGSVTVWLCGLLPDEDECIAFSDTLAEKLPLWNFVNFRGLTPEGYQAVSEDRQVLSTIWNEHREWIIGRIDYDFGDREIVLSTRYSTD